MFQTYITQLGTTTVVNEEQRLQEMGKISFNTMLSEVSQVYYSKETEDFPNTIEIYSGREHDMTIIFENGWNTVEGSSDYMAYYGGVIVHSAEDEFGPGEYILFKSNETIDEKKNKIKEAIERRHQEIKENPLPECDH